MKKGLLSVFLITLVIFSYYCILNSYEQPKLPKEKTTVKEVIAKSECNYIVKDEITYSILEPKEYLNEEVTGLAVCEDTENTICIFVTIEDEKLHIRK